MKNRMFSIFTNKKQNEQIVEFQRGIVRTNCVDCLDRTNCFQQIIGEIALGIQVKFIKQYLKNQFYNRWRS